MLYSLIILMSYIAPSGPPQNFNGTAISPSVIMLYWEPPSPMLQNGVIQFYTVSCDDSQSDSFDYNTTTELFHNETGLSPFTAYICKVAAHTLVGMGPYTTSLNISTLEAGNVLHLKLINIIFFSSDFTSYISNSCCH